MCGSDTHTITASNFFPEEGDVTSPCSSFLVTVRWGNHKGNDFLASRVLEPHSISTHWVYDTDASLDVPLTLFPNALAARSLHFLTSTMITLPCILSTTDSAFLDELHAHSFDLILDDYSA